MINVGIDISSLVYHRGVSAYTANLIKALKQNQTLNLYLYGASFRQNKILQNFAKAEKISTSQTTIQKIPPSILAKLWQLGLNPIKKQLPKIELFHSWDWLQPPDKNLKLVSTIHDLAILKYPESAHPEILKAHQKSWEILKNREAEIIAVSNSTKTDLINLLNWPAKKITVIHEALPAETLVAEKKLTENKYLQIKNNLLLNRPYLLFVGSREPRKNLIRLIKAWEPLKNEIDLIIAGESAWDETDKLDKIKNLRFLGRVSDEELVVLYSEAEVFCYPSLDEGFGLPILEAFHFGTPVLTSDCSGMKEVAGNAAILVNPKSIEEINKGLKKLLNETGRQAQERLQKMIIRQHQFSWDKVAKQTVEVYKKTTEE